MYRLFRRGTLLGLTLLDPGEGLHVAGSITRSGAGEIDFAIEEKELGHGLEHFKEFNRIVAFWKGDFGGVERSLMVAGLKIDCKINFQQFSTLFQSNSTKEKEFS